MVTDCSDIDNTCLAADDEYTVTEEQVIVSLDKGSVYFIIVDGYGNTSNYSGSYSLKVEPL